MKFSQVLAQFDAGQQEIPAGWTQGRACFGGLVAALLYGEVKKLVPDRPPRSLFVSFIGPVAAGEVSLEAQVLRAGGSVTQAESRIVQEGATVAIMQASFGLPRESKIAVEGAVPPEMKSREEAFELPFVDGVSPEFLRFFETRWGTKNFPFSKSKDGSFGGWIRFQEDLKVEHQALLALMDAWPPAVIPMYKHPAPSSSLTWTVEFLTDELEESPWWQFHVDTEHARDGYCVTQGQMWSASGELVALSRQTVTIFT